MKPIQRTGVYVAVFLGGAMLMSLEIAAFRIIGKTFGSALRETTAVIAVFLAAMSIGYWAGGRIGDRRPRPSTLVAALMNAAALLLCVPWLDALIAPRIAASGLDYALHAFLATSVLFGLPTVLLASTSPIAVRLMSPATGQSGSTAGSISAISTVGSIAGSVATAFFLIDWLGSINRTVMFVSLGTCLAAASLLLTSMHSAETARGTYRRYALAAATALVLIVLPAAAFIQSTRLSAGLMEQTGTWRTVFVGDSPYHRVVVRERAGKVREMTFGMGAQSRMLIGDPFGPGAPLSDSFHIARLIRPNIRRVLVIGLGGGTTAKQFARYYDDVTVDAVEIDPLVVDVAKRFFEVEESDRLRIHVGDGRMFLKRSTEKWDLIIVDSYTTTRYGDTVPPHMVTREFFAEAAGHLNEGGIVHFHCAFGRSKLLPALQKTLGSSFRYVLATDSQILASDVAMITAKETLLERGSHSPARHLPQLRGFITRLGPPPAADDAIPVLTDDYSPVDTLSASR